MEVYEKTKRKNTFNAIEKWFEITPELFLQKPDEFGAVIVSLLKTYTTSYYKQPL